MKKNYIFLLFAIQIICMQHLFAQKIKFNDNWFFKVDTANQWNEESLAQKPYKPVSIPHDWSIEQPFDIYSPSGNRGAALRGGLGLYRKEFKLSSSDKQKQIFIIFDGVYMNSTVWINGHKLGTRPFGYISFEYNLSPYLRFNGEKNILEVRVENKQPNSRWYSGSGIYRNVWLDKRGITHIKNWSTYVKTTALSEKKATIHYQLEIANWQADKKMSITNTIYNPKGKKIYSHTQELISDSPSFQINIPRPALWDINHPQLYNIKTSLQIGKTIIHQYNTTFGLRQYHFDQQKGFFLNGRPLKIIGACMHHDLGALGAAINTRAMERQLQILKKMGINGIRTAHNPPAPEWLALCDKMGFLVMNETFDVWTWDKENTPYNYNLYFKEWHEKDLSDHIRRDRNHPSIILWSIGNEIPEQNGGTKDTIGRSITRQLVNIIKRYDDRPITAGMNRTVNANNLYQSDALDIIGVNYHHTQWKDLGTTLFPSTKPYILAENVSALASRGEYDFPADSIRRWAGISLKNNRANADLTCSAFENCSAPWASTNEEALKLFLKYPYLSGMYLWTGFDYLGEPTPYPFPARSSYFGIVDMAGFPKDSYYLYKSIFTKENVLHILPHWNWKTNDTIDVHVYFNNADTVELRLNNQSLGKKTKQGDDLFVRFPGIPFKAGKLKAISTLKGKKIAEKIVQTADSAYQLKATVDRKTIQANGEDLAFITIAVQDKNGNLVPNAKNNIQVHIEGVGNIAALDNGWQTDLTPYSNKTNRKAYNGLLLAIVKASKQKGQIKVTFTADGLKPTSLSIQTK